MKITYRRESDYSGRKNVRGHEIHGPWTTKQAGCDEDRKFEPISKLCTLGISPFRMWYTGTKDQQPSAIQIYNSSWSVIWCTGHNYLFRYLWLVTFQCS